MKKTITWRRYMLIVTFGIGIGDIIVFSLVPDMASSLWIANIGTLLLSFLVADSCKV